MKRKSRAQNGDNMKIGIFGGTFNPPHKGHTRLVTDFTERLGLDKVLIIPDKTPVHKACDDLASDESRLDMCRLAFVNPKFQISRMEIDRSSASYTIITLDEIKKNYPEAEIFLIIGSDMFLSFHEWKNYREIMKGCTLCVASRTDSESIDRLRSYALSQFGIEIKKLDGRGIIISPSEPFEISSEQLREKIKNGDDDIYEYLDKAVYDYIRQRGLYGYRQK